MSKKSIKKDSSYGYIHFTSFENARNMDDLDKFDIKLHITRHKNKGLLVNFVHVPQLSPSEDLFNKTMYK